MNLSWDLFWEKYQASIIILLAVILVASVLIFNQARKWLSLPASTPVAIPTSTPAGLGSELYEEVSNPVENVSDTNPFNAKVNPYKDTYKNPFD